MNISFYLDKYLRHRPLFLSLIRSKEAYLYAKHLPLKSPSLDLGCGDGFFAKVAFGKLDIGLDVKDSRISEVEKDVYKKIIIFSGRRIPLETNSIGTVVSNCVLEHIKNLDEVLREVHRVLKPGGKFIISVMAKPWEENLLGAIIMGHTYRQWLQQKQRHLNLLTHSQWTTAFTTTGFKVQTEVGYLSPTACRLIEISHYLSLPSLLTYKLWGTWNVRSATYFNFAWLRQTLVTNVSPNISGAIFFELEK